jgi:hypothetical protein
MKSIFLWAYEADKEVSNNLIEQTKSNLLLVMCQSKIFEIWAESLAELSVQVTLF